MEPSISARWAVAGVSSPIQYVACAFAAHRPVPMVNTRVANVIRFRGDILVSFQTCSRGTAGGFMKTIMMGSGPAHVKAPHRATTVALNAAYHPSCASRGREQKRPARRRPLPSKPTVRIELTTSALRKLCSTVELRRRQQLYRASLLRIPAEKVKPAAATEGCPRSLAGGRPCQPVRGRLAGRYNGHIRAVW